MGIKLTNEEIVRRIVKATNDKRLHWAYLDKDLGYSRFGTKDGEYYIALKNADNVLIEGDARPALSRLWAANEQLCRGCTDILIGQPTIGTGATTTFSWKRSLVFERLETKLSLTVKFKFTHTNSLRDGGATKIALDKFNKLIRYLRRKDSGIHDLCCSIVQY